MKQSQHLYPILKYIDENLEGILTAKEIASVAGYSEYYFIRMFKKEMNTTVMDYVCKRRLIKASEDILLGEKIIDVAIKYGWQSHSGFVKAFKKEFGFYPSFLRAMKVAVDNLGGRDMSHVFLESTTLGTVKEELFALLQEKIKGSREDVNMQQLDSVYKSACAAYKDVKRYSGEEYITHLLNVSLLLVELEANTDIVLAGMFCDVVEKGVVTLEELKNELPSNVYDIVEKVQKCDLNSSLELEEAVIVKLAERLHNMRTIEYIDDSKKHEKAKETIELFMPLARKLGNKKLMDELNDLSMRFL